MRKLSSIILILLFTFSCSDKEEMEPAPESVKTPQTELISLEYNSIDNSIKIVWRPVEIEGFVSYKVYRLESATNVFSNISVIANLGKLRKEIKNSNLFSYTDTDIPYNAYVNYVVVTVYENPFNQYKEQVVSINHLYYERAELAFEILSVEKLNNGLINLEWEKDENDNFSNYSIHRTETIYDASLYRMDIFKNEFSISEIINQSEITYEDSSSFLSEYITYGVSKEVNGNTIESKNTITIKNPRFIDFVPIEMVKNPLHENEVIIIGGDGEILFYNPYNFSIIHSIDISARVHHPVIETYNGVQQLYIPSENGKIYVYSLEDYRLVQEIDLDTNIDIISMIIKENYIIFLEKSISGYYSHFSYYDIENDIVHRNTGYHHKSSRLVNSTSTYFFRLEPVFNGHQNESSINKYNFINGELDFSLGIDNGSIKSEQVFAVAPDFSYIISTEYGFHLKLNYNDLSEDNLGNYGYPMSFNGYDFIGIQEKYSDIYITEDHDIYFAIKEFNRIVMHKYLDFRNVSKEFDTQGKPLLFTLLNNDIIVINQSENTNKSFIEIIND
ncbi:hypothetical protein L3X37_07240 [Sabulilitoribacter arenilitoris]|uniref:Uncharacterized protein n=1 Tax=Wocania arenilitoris TaxID=2044858 RepID=A0AAE3EQC6_9FLAO|nr:hypothetical protein [Wocania arenilitoris]MCF7568155.1 hypothetical protein [Wocania arenilitoris]